MRRETEILNGRFLIQRKLDRASSIHIFVALDRLLGESVFIQVIDLRLAVALGTSPADRVSVADAITVPKHPGIAQPYTAFIEDERLYLVIEYVQGATLAQEQRRALHPLPEEMVLFWAEELGDILNCLHQQSPPVYVCALDPAGIIVQPDSYLKVIDHRFIGLRRLWLSPRTALDTVANVAPETTDSTVQIDPRADVYALGALMYLLLTGNEKPLGSELMRVRLANPSVSANTEWIIRKATHPEPAQRFKSMDELTQLLHSLVSPPGNFMRSIYPSNSRLARADIFPRTLTVSHPKTLSIGKTSTFIVAIHPSAFYNAVKRYTLAKLQEKDNLRPDEVGTNQYLFGTSAVTAKIKLSSPKIDFEPAEGIILSLPEGKDVVQSSFLGQPKDVVATRYAAKIRVSVTVEESREEVLSDTFSVKIDDYVFDHVSRPLTSRAIAATSTVAGLSLWILSFLEQFDKTFGYPGGTAALVIAALFGLDTYLRYHKKTSINVP